MKLASLVGYKVVTVASKRNWGLVKSLGAAAVFDYHDPDVISSIKTWVQEQGLGPLKKGLDTISENGSQEKSVELLGEGGRLITLCKDVLILLLKAGFHLFVFSVPSPKNFDSKGVDVHRVLIYSALKPKNEDDFRQMVEWNKEILPAYLESEKLSKGVVPLKVFSGGLDHLPEALDYVRQGKTSGQKVVVTLK